MAQTNSDHFMHTMIETYEPGQGRGFQDAERITQKGDGRLGEVAVLIDESRAFAALL
jgi:hypothetical protein